jgi:aspartate-semialdehyde dehydrogenase
MNLIYPNPAKDVIHVLLNENIEADKKDRIAVYDVNGRLIEAISILKNNEPIAINVANYNNGNYVIKYEGKKKTESKKILIQK